MTKVEQVEKQIEAHIRSLNALKLKGIYTLEEVTKIQEALLKNMLFLLSLFMLPCLLLADPWSDLQDMAKTVPNACGAHLMMTLREAASVYNQSGISPEFMVQLDHLKFVAGNASSTNTFRTELDTLTSAFASVIEQNQALSQSQSASTFNTTTSSKMVLDSRLASSAHCISYTWAFFFIFLVL